MGYLLFSQLALIANLQEAFVVNRAVLFVWESNGTRPLKEKTPQPDIKHLKWSSP